MELESWVAFTPKQLYTITINLSGGTQLQLKSQISHRPSFKNMSSLIKSLNPQTNQTPVVKTSKEKEKKMHIHTERQRQRNQIPK
jgi:preprotein translocase subunit SecD